MTACFDCEAPISSARERGLCQACEQADDEFRERVAARVRPEIAQEKREFARKLWGLPPQHGYWR